MLFNSFPFLFVFLPIALVGYQLAGHLHRRGVVVWLSLASLAFYGYWKPWFLFVLCGSIALNYVAACLISRRIPNSADTRIWMWGAIFLNLAALCYFKYLFPMLEFLNGFWHSPHQWGRVLLPLGISFFTFTQIAYLVDLQQGAAEVQDFASYLLFVTFFPHLIAGPIIHHKSIMPQFQEQRVYRLDGNDLAVGFSWFIMGLFKKVMLADNFATIANPVFQHPGAASASDAWFAALAYVFQLYFDFSGYSDMACGLARMFSIQFPLNFSSPYKATNIIDFWRRWHITLSDYVSLYLYKPFQFGIARRRLAAGKAVTRKAQGTPEGFFHMVALPTTLTMFIAGIWHGAGFTFLIFGLLHGIYLTVAHAWRIFRPRKGREQPGRVRGAVNHVSALLLTFGSVMLSQVFFRAQNVPDALLLIGRMFSRAGRPGFGSANPGSLSLLVLGGFIVWALPNTQQILSKYHPALALTEYDLKPSWIDFDWQPRPAWALVLAVALLLSLSHFEDPSTFLYFQF
jgi:alginate O-acetyltransferase complex protein AlgI